MENKINTNTTKKELNDTQKAFLTALKDYPNGTTLIDLKIDTGVEYKTGTINCLIAKGLVATEKVTIKYNKVYRDTIVGYTNVELTKYRLA